METKAYIKWNEKEKKLQHGKYYELYQGLYETPLDEVHDYYLKHKQEFDQYDKEMGDFDEKVIEPSYKEIYALFREATGHTLKYYKIDWEWFKLSVDENMPIDDEVYLFYKPLLLNRLLESAKCWENTNR